MLNPIEMFKVAVLHLNRDCMESLISGWPLILITGSKNNHVKQVLGSCWPQHRSHLLGCLSLHLRCPWCWWRCSKKTPGPVIRAKHCFFYVFFTSCLHIIVHNVIAFHVKPFILPIGWHLDCLRPYEGAQNGNVIVLSWVYVTAWDECSIHG